MSEYEEIAYEKVETNEGRVIMHSKYTHFLSIKKTEIVHFTDPHIGTSSLLSNATIGKRKMILFFLTLYNNHLFVKNHIIHILHNILASINIE